jgi:DeoR family ulaG and ulaABCDEF operon transcriptional repressor
MFVGAAAVNRHGLMQSDIILVQAERKLLALTEELIALVDSSKFHASAGHMLCELSHVDTLITDSDIGDASAKVLESADVRLIVVDAKRRNVR